MIIVVRHPRDAELAAFVNAVTTVFLERPDVDTIAAEIRPFWTLDRLWAAFDGTKLCGTFRSWPTELTVPGGARVAGSAIDNVTVLPTYRRHGILRSMLSAEHEAMRNRGEVLGLLHAAEYPIYGRFGYGPGCSTATWTLSAQATEFQNNPAGSVDLVQPDGQVRETIERVYEARRLGGQGEIRRREYGWDFELGLREMAWQPRWSGFVAVRRDSNGSVDGYVRYRVEHKLEGSLPRGAITVDDMQTITDDAAVALWRFLGNVDLVNTVTADSRSPWELLPWLLTNPRAAVMSDVCDALWVRLLDIPRALEARTYEREASVVLEIRDPEASGDRRQRLLLDASPAGATCRVTGRSPDITLHVGSLGAAYLGGTRLRRAVLADGVDEHRSGALRKADRLFKTLDEPWCSTFF